MFSALISELLLTFSFITIGNAILFREQTLTMKGRFEIFVEIDENAIDTYSNYPYQPLEE